MASKMSVTNLVKNIKQPYGGYLKASALSVNRMDDGLVLSEKENIHATKCGLAVDYLSRYMNGTHLFDAFEVSFLGAGIAERFRPGSAMEAERLAGGITGLDDFSIINACALVSFDQWLRNTFYAAAHAGSDHTAPDAATIENIRIMVNRSLAFKKYGPVTEDGFTFEPHGYDGEFAGSGDGDFLTADTLWDFKVSKHKPNSQHTLQLLMYYIMGRHSGNPVFDGIRNIGIFNPRLNTVYTYAAADVPVDVLRTVETEVIGFKDRFIPWADERTKGAV